MTQTWLITGSSRGLGRALAEAVLDAGHNVVATARRPEQVQDLVDRHPDRARAVALDVTDRTAAAAAVRAAVDAFGRLDVLVNNAGYARVNSIEDFDEDDFRAQVDANFFGVVNVTRAALPVLREQGAGHVVQVSSVGGRVTTPGLSAYQSAKFAVGGFSEVLAKEVAPLGVRVTVLEPGGMRTDWAGSSMAVHPVSPAYEPTVGAINAVRTTLMARAASDPAKVADVVLALVEMAEPPVRLLLGSDAVRFAGQAERSRAESDASWRELSESTDYDDLTEENLDPLATLRG